MQMMSLKDSESLSKTGKYELCDEICDEKENLIHNGKLYLNRYLNAKVLDICLEELKQVVVKDIQNKTSKQLHVIIQEGNLKSINLLINNGTDGVDKKDEDVSKIYVEDGYPSNLIPIPKENPQIKADAVHIAHPPLSIHDIVNDGTGIIEIDTDSYSRIFCDHFISKLNEDRSIFFVNLVGNGEQKLNNEDFSTLSDKIKRPIVIQYIIPGSTILYIKEKDDGPFNEVKLNGEGNINSDEFQKKLESENDFGIALLVQGLKSQIVGKFVDVDVKSLLKVELNSGQLSSESCNLIDYALKYDNTLLVRYLSRFEWDLSTLKNEGESSIGIAVNKSSIETICALFSVAPEDALDENVWKQKNVIDLLNKTCDDYGNTPLILSAHIKDYDKLSLFLNIGVDVNENNKFGQCAMDFSWENKHYSSVLKLIKADSNMPHSINEVLDTKDEDAENLKKFLSDRDELHKEIEDGNLEKVKELIHKHPSQVHLNRCNESALHTAFIKKHLKICAYLSSTGAKFSSSDEEEDFDMSVDREEYGRLKEKLYYEIENKHLMVLIKKSKSSGEFPNFEEIIKDYYNTLNISPYISIILKVLEYSKLENIIFDFKADSTKGMDHEDTPDTKGKTDFKKGVIKIAAKESDKEGRTKSEILGTLAQELTHFAMSFLYSNDCNPYRKGGNEFKFEKICDEILCKHYAMDVKENLKKSNAKNVVDLQSIRPKIMEKFKGKTPECLKYVESKVDRDLINSCNLDDIIRRVYTNYEMGHWHLELIARIPHILAEYGDQKGMEVLKTQVPGLLEYYENRVLKDCDLYLKTISSLKHAEKITNINDNKGEINKIMSGNIRLKEPFECKPQEHHYKNTFFLVKTSCIHLCTTYYYQLLSKEYDILLQLHCLFLKKSYFDENKNDLLNTVKSHACKTLVLIADSPCDLERMFYDLKGIKNKVILIVNENHSFECNISNFTWNSLEASSKEYLMNKEFLFKKKKTSLQGMFGAEFEVELLDEAALACLIETMNVEIVEENEYECENHICYIERHLRHQTIISDILKEGYNDILSEKDKYNMLLFISNANKDNLLCMGASEVEIQHFHDSHSITVKKKKRILFCGDESEESLKQMFDKICKKVEKDQTVHWLHLQADCLIWKDSNRDFCELRKYVNKDVNIKYKDVSEFFLIGIDKKIVILADNSGMGKSTVVSKISYLNQTNHLGYWVVRFNLFNYMPPLKKIDFDAKDTDKGIDFVTEMLNYKNPFEKCLFKLSCKCSNKVVVIFDGFDEISSSAKDKLVILVKALKRSKVSQVWIVTRLYEKEYLENELEVLAYTLNPWKKEHQKKFMIEFWIKKLEAESVGLPSLDLPSYADSLLEDLSKSLYDEKGKFTNVPLHIFMLAEVAYESKFKVNDINLDDLYEFFVDAKFNIFYKKKGLEVEIYKGIRHLINKVMKRGYRIKAMEAFLKEEEYFPKEHFLQNIGDFKELMTQIGLATSCMDGIKFIHKTFEEYFFMEGMMENSNYINIQRILLGKILVDSNYTVVRKFLNCKIEKNMDCVQFNRELLKDTNIFESTHFHKLANEGLDSILELIFKKFPEKVLTLIFNLDEKRENILHCACKNNSNRVIKIILDFFVDEKKKYYLKKLISKRNLCYRKPLTYAILNDNVEIVQLLFEFANTNFEYDWTFKFMLLNANKSDSLQHTHDSALHFAALKGSKGVFKYLWDVFKTNKPFLNNLAITVTKKGDTILHVSANSGCIAFVKDLLIHFKDNLRNEECYKNLLLSVNSIGYTFFDVAVLKDNIDFLYILKECYDREMLDEKFFKTFLNMKASKWCDTVLHHAAYKSHSDVFDKLLDFAEYVFGKESYQEFLLLCNHKGYTFVHKAASYSTSEFFSRVCERIKTSLEGSFVQLLKVPNKYGNTILHTVAHRGDLKIAKEVCEMLSNEISDEFILKTDKDGDTFLHKALIKGNVEVLEYMTKFFEPKLSSKTKFQELLNKRNKYEKQFWDLAKKVVNEDRASKVEKFAEKILCNQSLE